MAGPTVFICDECVELCMDIIREENKSSMVKSRDGVPTPQDIIEVLDEYVIGLKQAKHIMSVPGLNNDKRMAKSSKDADVKLATTHIKLCRPTSFVKTQFAKNHAKTTDLSFTI